MTNITELAFDDGADLTVELRDSHVFSSVGAVEFQEHGLMMDVTESGVTNRLFIPYEFLQSIDQLLS
jgi:hypothetical protein